LTDVSVARTAYIIRAMMEAVRTSETSVNFNVTTRRYIPEESKLHFNFVYLKYKTGLHTLTVCHTFETQNVLQILTFGAGHRV
jgi:hypothetical protein